MGDFYNANIIKKMLKKQASIQSERVLARGGDGDIELQNTPQVPPQTHRQNSLSKQGSIIKPLEEIDDPESIIVEEETKQIEEPQIIIDEPIEPQEIEIEIGEPYQFDRPDLAPQNYTEEFFHEFPTERNLIDESTKLLSTQARYHEPLRHLEGQQISLPSLVPPQNDYTRRPSFGQWFLYHFCRCCRRQRDNRIGIKEEAKQRPLTKQQLDNLNMVNKIERENDQTAQRLGFLTNEEVFNLPMNKGVPSSRDPRTMIQIAEEKRMKQRNEVIGLFIVVVDVIIVADENDAGTRAHALIDFNGEQRRTRSSDQAGQIDEKVVFKVDAAKQQVLRVAVTAVEEHPVREELDQQMGELKIDMPPQYSSITHRWFQLRPLKDKEARGKILMGIDVVPFQHEDELSMYWNRKLTFFPYLQWPQILKLSKLSKLQLCLNEARSYIDEYKDYKRVKPEELGSALISYSPRLCYQLGLAVGDYDHDKFLALGKLFECPIMDRTNTLFIERSTSHTRRHLKLVNMYPIPERDKKFRKSFEQCMLDRADFLLDKFQGRKINLLWSGGIDTTAVIVAFMRRIEDRQLDPKCIVATFCERSKQEYPKFYEEYISKMECEVIEGHVREFVDGHKAIVTGDPADMIFGTYLMGVCLKKPPAGEENPLYGKIDKKWQDVMPEYMVHKGLLSRSNTRQWVGWIQPFVDKCPIPCKTVFDFLWWGSFGLKYQHDLTRIFYNGKHPRIRPAILQSVNNFYDCWDFTQWSYNFHDLKMSNHKVWASYKQPLKKFIFDYTGDLDYYRGKLKTRSVCNAWGYDMAIDSKWNRLQFGEYSISIDAMKQKYGADIFERYVQSYNIPQPKKKTKQIRKTKTKNTKSGMKTIPINKTKTYYTKPPPPKPIKPLNAPAGTTKDGVIYGGTDVYVVPMVIDGQDIIEESSDGVEYGHDIGGSGGDVGE